MNPRDQQPISPEQPVAYDAEGRPLYLHPSETAQPVRAQAERSRAVEEAAVKTADGVDAEEMPILDQRASHVTSRPESIDWQNFDPRIRSQYGNEPRVVHTTRDLEPKAFTVSQDLQSKHDLSVRRYPFLNLSEGEYVILDIRRHLIGMITPILITAVIILGILGFAAIYPSIVESSAIDMMPDASAMLGMALLFSLIVALGGAGVLWVYLQNQFFMTNESVIQEIQESLFSRHEQTVSLGSIEDASFRRSGILQTIFDYGTIRLSTEGEETTYVFQYVSNPKKQIAILNNAIESFKNGRPVRED